MKKYEVCSKIGEVLFGAAFMCGLFTLTIDVDSSPDAFSFMVKALLVCIGVGIIGAALYDLAEVEGFFISLFIVIGASMYKLFRKPFRTFKKCYKIVKHVDSFNELRDIYDEYVESLYTQEENKNREENYEQAK